MYYKKEESFQSWFEYHCLFFSKE